jgi:uncharacterized protein (DUF1499 family)
LGYRSLACALLASLLGGCATVLAPQFGIDGGQLRGCPEQLACATTAAGDPAPLRFVGDAREARADLVAAIGEFPGVRIVSSHRSYLRAEFPSKARDSVDRTELSFPERAGYDDVEFHLVAEQRVIHVRSVARLGRLDLGENRARIESLRARFAARQAARGSQP